MQPINSQDRSYKTLDHDLTYNSLSLNAKIFSYVIFHVAIFHASGNYEVKRRARMININFNQRYTPRILHTAKEDSCSGMRTRKLVTEANVKTVGYDVHSVHIAVIINIPNPKLCMISWSSLCLFTSGQVSTNEIQVTNFCIRIPE